MQKIDVLKVINPYDFWIAEKHPPKFLEMINEYIVKENDSLFHEALSSSSQTCSYINDADINENTIIVVRDPFHSTFWYRAKIISRSSSFNSTENFTCFLIDTGETMNIPKINCRNLRNINLKNIPPLAKHCSLYGISPSFPRKSENSDWIPAATEYFYKLLNTGKVYTYNQLDQIKPIKTLINFQETANLYLKYKKKANIYDHKSTNQVKIYIQINEIKEEPMCINDLLVTKRLAVYSNELQALDQATNCLNDELDEDGSVFYNVNDYNNNNASEVYGINQEEMISSSTLSLCDEKEHFNLNHIKTHLNTKTPNRSITMEKFMNEHVYNTDATTETKSLSNRSRLAEEAHSTFEKKLKILEMREKSTEPKPAGAQLKRDAPNIINLPQKKPPASQSVNSLLAPMKDYPENVLIDAVKIAPILNTNDIRLHQSVRDYLNVNGLKKVNEFEQYLWPTIFRGRHVFGLSTELDYLINDVPEKNVYLSFIVPLVSLLLHDSEDQDLIVQPPEDGYIKHAINRANNGPLLLILCTSCRSAQRIHDIIRSILDMASRVYEKNRSQYPRVKELKLLLLQAGGNDYQYDVALTNGVDILICSTPFILLRMLGHKRTNLQRLRYMVLDEANVLIEKFSWQMKTLMSHYGNLLAINDRQTVVQFVLIANYWSNKLRHFMSSFLMERALITTNRLEASYFGQTHHTTYECTSPADKLGYLNEILGTLCRSSPEGGQPKNTVIFTNSQSHAVEIGRLLLKWGYANVSCVHKETPMTDIRAVEKKWLDFDLFLSRQYDYDITDRPGTNRNLILVCDQDSIRYLNIPNAKCVIHFDFPKSKTSFGDRLWFMRKYFTVEKKTWSKQANTQSDVKYTSKINLAELNAESSKEKINLDLIGDMELVEEPNDRLLSFIFFSQRDKEFAVGFVDYLKRIGVEESNIPASLLEMATERRGKKELKKSELPLCPYVKSFGECMNINRNNCPYRHIPNETMETVALLNQDFYVPSEGYIKFKIAHVEDTNHFFIHLVSHQNLSRVKTTEYDKFLAFDIELQYFYSNEANVRNVTQYKMNDLYAFKDTSSLFKRISIEKVLEGGSNIAYEVLVKAIDYGARYKLSTHELIRLPSKFKVLPPQAIEVYLCDIRPMDLDLNWSNASTVFLNDKLAKSKEFIGKIQLAAGNTLWLNPISSYKHLKAIDLLVIEDSIRLELIENNYGFNYPNHMRLLKELFRQNNLNVPKVEDEALVLEKECMDLFEKFYDFVFDNNTITYAHLDKTPDILNCVLVSSINTPNIFYVQNSYSNELLKRLNQDIKKFLLNIKNLKEYAQKIRERTDSDEKDDLQMDDDDKKNCLEYIRRTEFFREHFNKTHFDWFCKNNKPLYCLARLRQDNEYFRAKIVDYKPAEDRENDKIKVFFVDYGDYDTIGREDIFPLFETFIKICPFQAIECSLDGIKPVQAITREDSKDSIRSDSLQKWSEEAGDLMWDLTHDDLNRYIDLFARVVKLEHMVPYVYVNTDEGLNLDGYKAAWIEPPKRHYKIKLFHKSYPEFIDIGHKLVEQNQARLSKEEEDAVFNSINLENDLTGLAKTLNNIAKQSINFFISKPDEKKQTDFLSMIESRIPIIQTGSENEIISTGIIQTFAKLLFFINNDKKFICLLKWFRKIFLLSKNPNYLRVFYENSGFSNLFKTIRDNGTKNEELIEVILKFFKETLGISEITKAEIASKENYLKAFWDIADKLKHDSTFYAKSLDLLNVLFTSIASDEKIEFTDDLIGKIEHIAKNIRKSGLTNNQLDEFNEIYAKYLSKKHIELKKEETEQDGDEKRKNMENVIRVTEYLDKINPYLTNNEFVNRNGITDDLFDSPEDSSDEEVQMEFENDFANLILNFENQIKSQIMNQLNEPKSENEWKETSEFKYPKITWDQTKSTIILKIMLKNVKDMDVKYGERSISFRAKLHENIYGFDFELFSEIDVSSTSNFSSRSEANYVFIEIKKKINAKWVRLLSTMNKPKFVKSEYNNLETSSDEEDKIKNKSGLDKFFEKSSTSKSKHLGKVEVEAKSSSETSSNFEDEICNDVQDSKDIYWD